MPVSRTDIIEQLRQDMLLLQGYKAVTLPAQQQVINGPIRYAFPNETFPVGAVHEFICSSKENNAASAGFVSGILSGLMNKGGSCCWVTSDPMIFPPAYKQFGIDPCNILIIHAPKTNDIPWIIEEILKSSAVVAVIAEIKEIGFKESRRFQLAAEQTGITGFMLRNNPKNLATCAATRWKIQPINSNKNTSLPGISYPRWHVELLKVRNGKPGNWQLEWRAGTFKYLQEESLLIKTPLRKIG
jgi:protein ImuA